MHDNLDESFVATKVLIEFVDGPMSFRVPRGATLGDVSEKLQNICKWHRGGAILKRAYQPMIPNGTAYLVAIVGALVPFGRGGIANRLREPKPSQNANIKADRLPRNPPASSRSVG